MGQKFVFFAVDYSFSMHAHNRKKDILFPGEDPSDGLDDNAATVQVKYSNNYTK